MTKQTNKKKVKYRNNFRPKAWALFLLCSAVTALFGQAMNSSPDKIITDQELINLYINSKEYKDIITFDASNIKQFWVDNSVMSKDGFIKILLESDKASKPLKIQLANVNETLDCKIDIITNEPDLSFSVLDSKSVNIGSPIIEEYFIQNRIISSTIHLDNTRDDAFNIVLSSGKKEIAEINKIILSFTNNKKSSFFTSPGSISNIYNNVDVFGLSTNSNQLSSTLKDSLTLTGKQTALFSKYNILVSNNDITTSVKIKNIGDKPTHIFVGYAGFSKDRTKLFGRNYPFKNNRVCHIVSADENSATIIVDSYPEWSKGCYVALNVKEDFSDIPNTALLDGTIVSVKEIENGYGEITLNKPLKKALEKGRSIRIHGAAGSYFYTNDKVLQPGEESTFISSIRKKEDSIVYSSKEFPKGVYYVKPLILSYSVEKDIENTIVISEYSTSF
jgi:hypothetical protein